MLSAMYAISPDDSFRWVNPMLAASDDRTAWENALARLVKRGLELNGQPHIVDAIHKGTQKASDVNAWLLSREEYHGLPPRDPRQQPITASQQTPTN